MLLTVFITCIHNICLLVWHLSLFLFFTFCMQTRVAAVFVFVSFTALLSVAGVPSIMKEVKVTWISILSLMLR